MAEERIALVTGGYVGYRMSKAGLNVLTRVIASETQGMGILIAW